MCFIFWKRNDVGVVGTMLSREKQFVNCLACRESEENYRMPRASLIAQSVKNLPVMRETTVQFLGWEDPLEKG